MYAIRSYYALVVVLGFYFRLSNLSYTLIAIFMVMHLVGSHYTYAEVPFGYTLQRWFGAERNMYDRLVHFSFGLLLAYPVREIFVRIRITSYNVCYTKLLRSMMPAMRWRISSACPIGRNGKFCRVSAFVFRTRGIFWDRAASKCG